jgi:hypothetical protein
MVRPALLGSCVPIQQYAATLHLLLRLSLQSQLLIGGNKLEDIPAFRTLLARVRRAGT